MENTVSLSQELGFGKGQDQIKKQVDPMINHNEKENIYVKENIYLCITASLCCTAEINTIL